MPPGVADSELDAREDICEQFLQNDTQNLSRLKDLFSEVETLLRQLQSDADADQSRCMQTEDNMILLFQVNPPASESALTVDHMRSLFECVLREYYHHDVRTISAMMLERIADARQRGGGLALPPESLFSLASRIEEQLASANARLKDAKDEVDRLYAITQAQSQSESPPSGLSGSPRSGKRRDRSPSAALGPLSPNSTRSRSQSGSHGDILNDLFGAVDDGVKEARTPRQGELRRKGLN